MKQILLLAALVVWGLGVHAEPVDETTARSAGQTFLTAYTHSQALTGISELQLAYKVGTTDGESNELTLFYVFNADDKGFVIVAGDDRVHPILGYSDQGPADPQRVPEATAKWLESYKRQIRDAIVLHIAATPDIAQAWAALQTPLSRPATRGVTAVSPLVQTRWDQSPHVNALCPGGSVTGCVATAMAQIMKYWNYPANGSGFHSYNHSQYGTLSANFGATTYNWTSMPNTVNGPNNAVATLMYHCGVSVEMDYSPQVSGAYVIEAYTNTPHCSEYALKTYFGYKSSMQGILRSNYTEAQWINLLKADLDAGKPILYAGFGSGGGHAFVCDGYDNNNFFHFNWGWGGAYDGYFNVNALNPSGTGTGGGTGGYNSNQQVIIGIEPASGGGGGPNPSPSLNMELYDFVTPSQSTISYAQGFSVSTNIFNNSTVNFSGDYCAAVFDSDGNFLDFIQVLTGYSLSGGFVYTNNLTFSTQGLISMLPGQYFAGVFYRPAGGNWILVANSGNYQNLIEMEVVYDNDIELNSDITVQPSPTLTQGSPVNVNLNIYNDGNTTFTGDYGVGLYNLDGDLVQTIGILTESNGLPPGFTYLSPFLTFSNSSVSADPGTYYLAVQHNPNNSGWQLTGSSYFQNPIRVTIQAPALSPDPYESNNTLASSYNLPISYSGNNGQTNTNGSNLHTETDADYYKLSLPGGSNYAITARLHDAYDSGNGNTYTCDALFSLSKDGVNWSETYDDVMSSALPVNGGGTLYIKIAPYFAGETGSYLLDVNVTRSASTGIETHPLAHTVTLRPNPAQEFVWVDMQALPHGPKTIELLDVYGRLIGRTLPQPAAPEAQLSLAELPGGVYMVNIHTDQGLITHKLIIAR